MFVEGPGGEFSAGMQQRERECVSSKLAQCKPRRESSMGLFPFQMCGSSQDKFEDTAAHLGQAAEKRLLALAVKNKNILGENHLAKSWLLSLLWLNIGKLILGFVGIGVIIPQRQGLGDPCESLPAQDIL